MKHGQIETIIWGLLLVVLVVEIEVDAKRHKVYKKCRYDKEKKWSDPGNYLNCSEEPQNIRDNKYDCCDKTNGDIYCCDPDDEFKGNPDLIWAGIGVLGSLLLIFTFVYNWCDTQTFPCLKKYEKQIEAQRKFWNSVADCTCCKDDPDSAKKYESAIRQVGVIYVDETKIAQYGKVENVHLKFSYDNDAYQC